MRRAGVMVSALLLVALAACGGEEEPEAAPDPPPDTAEDDEAGQDEEDPAAGDGGEGDGEDGSSHRTLEQSDDDEPDGPPLPLTGEPSTDQQDLEDPVVAVKVDNHPSARPPVGLEDADVILTQQVEHGLTRLLALHHAEVPERIGPVRSARRVEAELVPPFGAALAISGAQQHILEELRQAGLRLYVDGARGAWERDPQRPAPHDLFVAGDSVRVDAREAGLTAPEAPWRHDEQEPQGAREVAGADLTYPGGSSTVSWRWDADEERWLRSQNGSPHGAASGERLGADNVLLVRVAPTGVEERPFEVQGSGELTVLRDGVAVEGTWEKPGPAAPHAWRDADGEQLPLAPGTTWIELVGTDGSVAVDDA